MKADVIAVERQNGFGEDSAERAPADESGNRGSRANLYRSIAQAFVDDGGGEKIGGDLPSCSD